MFYFLNKNIRYLRKKHNYTIPALAKKLGLSKSGLDNIESGNRNTSLEVLDKIHIIFDISVDDLLYKDLSNENEQI